MSGMNGASRYSTETSTKTVDGVTTITTTWKLPTEVVHPSSLRFFELLGEVGVIHSRKQADYGHEDDPFANIRSSQEFGIAPWLGSEIRANDKTNRIKAFARKGELENESLPDSLLDKSSYSIISIILLEEELGHKLI